MLIELCILNASGDFKLTWDPTDAGLVEAARQEIERLKARGYSFFLVKPYTLEAGATAMPDLVEMGQGALEVRRISTKELLDTDPADWPEMKTEEGGLPAGVPEVKAEDGGKPKRGRGRPAKAQVVGVPQQRGG